MANKIHRGRVPRHGFRLIVQKLQEDIQSHVIPSGSLLPTERELCDQFGASRTTIRKALAELVQSGWGVHLENRGVQATRGQRLNGSKRIALLHQDLGIHDQFLPWIQSFWSAEGFALESWARPFGFLMDEDIERAIQEDLGGVMVLPYQSFPDRDQLERLGEKVPLVIMNHDLMVTRADFASFDHERESALATEHLIKLGCRRIGHFGVGTADPDTISHIRGYFCAMFKNGLEPKAMDLGFTVVAGETNFDCESFVSRLFTPTPPQGLVLFTDLYAAQIVEAIEARGLIIGTDLHIVVIGNDFPVKSVRGRVPTMSIAANDLMKLASEMLLARIRRPDSPYQRRLVSIAESPITLG